MAEKSNLQWWVLLTVIIGTFLGRLDQSIVNLALPNMIQDFHISISAAGWIATAYIIANAVFVPVWGKLGDSLGRKKVYLMGFAIFIVGSMLAGLAWNFSSMIVFRIIQAIAGSADYPTAMAIIAFTFKEAKARAQAMGIWSASFAAGVVFGPLLGGPLIDIFGWRSVFLINIPIGIIGIIMAVTFIEESTGRKQEEEFDFAGAITLGIMLSSLVLVLDKGTEWGWTSLLSMSMYSFVLLFSIIFYYVEKKHKEPIVDFKFFKNPVFTGTLVNNFIVFMGMMGGVFLIPIFAQTYLGYTATQSGYLFIPMAVCMMVGAQIGGKLVGKVKANSVIFTSTLVAAAGIYLFRFLIDSRASALDIIIPLSVMAFGMGLGMAQRTSAIASSVPDHEVGVASSVLALARNIAGAFGIAVFSSILASSTGSHVLSIAHYTTLNDASVSNMGMVVPLIILMAQIEAFKTVFTLSALIVFLGALVALVIRVDKEYTKKIYVES